MEDRLRALGGRLRELRAQAPLLDVFVRRCLESMRWGGSAVLMVVDAALTSSGFNYFTSIIPAVLKFKRAFVDTGRVASLEDLARADPDEFLPVWRNRRMWHVARGVAEALLSYGGPDDRSRLREWARRSTLEGRRADPVGSVKGVGVVTYQYLRMMGGVDTAMPDRVVKSFVRRVGALVGVEVPWGDVEFVRFVEAVARAGGPRPTEVTWMAWLVDSEGEKVLSRKYSDVLDLI